MIRRPPRSTRVRSSAASDVYKRQVEACDDRAEGRLACAVLSEQGVHLPSGEAEVDVGVGEYSVEGLVDVPELDRRWDFALWSIRHRDRLVPRLSTPRQRIEGPASAGPSIHMPSCVSINPSGCR